MQLNELLQSFGNSSLEVANKLRWLSIKGLMRSHTHCPILNAIFMFMPNLPSTLMICAGNKEGNDWKYVVTFSDVSIEDPDVPQAVLNFIGDFDSGQYPDLVATQIFSRTTRAW